MDVGTRALPNLQDADRQTLMCRWQAPDEPMNDDLQSGRLHAEDLPYGFNGL